MRIGPRAPWSLGGLPAVLLLGLALGGCRADTRVALDDVPVRELEPGRTLGGFSSALGAIRWIGYGPDGTVALGQLGDHVVRVFDAGGRVAAEVGGPGVWTWRGSSVIPLQGGAGWVGDTLWVHNAGLGRILLDHPVGTRIRSLPPLPGAQPDPSERGMRPSYLLVWPLALFPGDTILVLADQAMGGGTYAEEGARVLMIRPDGRIVRDLAPVPPGQHGDTEVSPQEFAAQPSTLHVAPAGDRVGLLEPAGGTGRGAWRLLVLTTRGDTLLERGYRLGSGAVARGVILGSDHSIWVTVSGGPGETWWLVLDPEGNPQARIRAPELGRILEAGETHLWASQPGPAGNLDVVMYRIR